MKRNTIVILILLVTSCYCFPQSKDSLKQSLSKLSSYYKVEANGKPLFVYDSPVASYVIPDIDGKVELTIRADRDVKWVDIRPKNLAIAAEWRDSTIRLSIEQPCNLSIEINGDALAQPLFVFAGRPEKALTDTSSSSIIYFGPGKIHRPGIISPKSGQTVYIAQGAIVEGVIEASEVKDVSVCGRGILRGKKDRWTDGRWHKMISFMNSKNISIKDICLIDGHTWQIVPINCKNVVIDNVKIISDNGGDDGIDICRSRNVTVTNSFIRTKDDCIAIKGNFDYPDEVITSNINISGCVFWNAAWGNGLDIGFELQCAEVNKIHVQNCDFIHVDKGATMSIHNGDKAKVSQVLFEDIRIEDSNQKLFDLAIFYNRYAMDKPHSQKQIDSIYLRGAWDGVLYLDKKQKKDHARFRGTIENITFRNISVTDGIFPFSLFCGYDENHMVKNVSIENLVIHGRKISSLKEAKIYTEYAEGIQIK